MTEFRHPRPLERFSRYRALAQEAREEAARASNEAARESYVFIADQWENLASGFPGFTRPGTRARQSAGGATLH